jgi:hypothetical protein
MRLTDDSCIVTGASGVARIDRNQFVRMLNSAKYTLNKFDMKDVQVQLLNDDVALVAYKVHEEMTVDGKPIALDAADSSTWIRRDGRWLCAAHSEAISGDPYGRDRKPIQ